MFGFPHFKNLLPLRKTFTHQQFLHLIKKQKSTFVFIQNSLNET
jgi:hypothetical protein